jgi:hypothetical protein
MTWSLRWIIEIAELSPGATNPCGTFGRLAGSRSFCLDGFGDIF